MLQGKKILVGISASIAAYKSILLVRLLVKSGAEIKVIMTPAAKDFVSPLVLTTLSKNAVVIDLETNNSWANHVELGRWADVMIIAPLSCNTLAKMAGGLCDNLLMAVYLSATCPVCVAPAMDEDMWHHPGTQRNLNTIKTFGNRVIPVTNGELASGLFGEGRMAEPEDIIQFIVASYCRTNELAGKKVLVTAGPTYEAIDPVRFIGNHSSGKMGFEIAEALYLRGADVHIIAGPTNCKKNFTAINQTNIVSGKDMLEVVMNNINTADIFIASAAVADYKPVNIAEQKIKKQNEHWSLELEKTDDILKQVGLNKKAGQFIVGFALETENEIENATKKITTKNLDAIIVNSYNETNKVFGADSNKVTIIDSNKSEHIFETKSKKEIAMDIANFIISKVNNEK